MRARAAARLGARVGPLRDTGTGDCLVLLFWVFKSRRWSLDGAPGGANAGGLWAQRTGPGQSEPADRLVQRGIYMEKETRTLFIGEKQASGSRGAQARPCSLQPGKPPWMTHGAFQR